MAGLLVHDCPHRGTTRSTFEVYAVVETKREYFFSLLCVCRCCRKPISFIVRTSNVNTIRIAIQSGEQLPSGVSIQNQFPPPHESKTPPDLPEAVERNFKQALDNAKLNNPDAAAMTLRKSIELGCKKSLSTSEDITFATSIKHLSSEQIIPDTLAEWANEIRFFGNEGAHEDMPHNEEELREAIEFADTLLQYLFTLPALLERRRNRKEEADQT